MDENQFSILGHTVASPQKNLEIFPAPAGLTTVVLESDEVTSLCPVTGQPDWETVRIEFAPNQSCIESKSLKLYFWSFRNQGAFCEALAAQIAADVYTACRPHWVRVSVTQKPRGGITIRAEAKLPLE